MQPVAGYGYTRPLGFQKSTPAPRMAPQFGNDFRITREMNFLTANPEMVKANHGVAQIRLNSKEGQPIGSGFFLNLKDRLYFLSNAHVADQIKRPTDTVSLCFRNVMQGGEYAWYSTQGIPARLLGKSDEKDLAIFELPGGITPQAEVQPLSIRDLIAEPIRKGEKVFLLGRSSERDRTVEGCTQTGQIASTATKRTDGFSGKYATRVSKFEALLRTESGDSGGPLVDAQGRLIGALTQGNLISGYFIPNTEITPFCESVLEKS